MSSHASGIAEQLLAQAGMDGWNNVVAIRGWLCHGGRADRTLNEVISLLSNEKAGSARNKAAALLQSAINGTGLGHYNVLELIEASWVTVSADDEWELV
jgi:hypothetical protein